MIENTPGGVKRTRIPAEYLAFYLSWVAMHSLAILAAYVIVQEVLHIRWFEPAGVLIFYLWVVFVGPGEWLLFKTRLADFSLEFPVGISESLIDKVRRYETICYIFLALWILTIELNWNLDWPATGSLLAFMPLFIMNQFFQMPKDKGSLISRSFKYVGVGIPILIAYYFLNDYFLQYYVSSFLDPFTLSVMFGTLFGVISGGLLVSLLINSPEEILPLKEEVKENKPVWRKILNYLLVLWLSYIHILNPELGILGSGFQPCGWVMRLQQGTDCMVLLPNEIKSWREEISKDGKYLAYITNDTIHILDIEKGKRVNWVAVREIEIDSNIRMAISPDSTRVGVQNQSKLILWDFHQDSIEVIDSPNLRNGFQFSEDGKYIIAVNESLYEVWEVESLESIKHGRANCLANLDDWRVNSENLIESYTNNGFICIVNWLSGHAEGYSAVMDVNHVYEEYVAKLDWGINQNSQKLILGHSKEGVWLIVGDSVKLLLSQEGSSEIRQKSNRTTSLGTGRIKVVYDGILSSDGRHAVVIYLDTIYVFETERGELIREIDYCDRRSCEGPNNIIFLRWQGDFLKIITHDDLQFWDVLNED